MRSMLIRIGVEVRVGVQVIASRYAKMGSIPRNIIDALWKAKSQPHGQRRWLVARMEPWIWSHSAMCVANPSIGRSGGD